MVESAWRSPPCGVNKLMVVDVPKLTALALNDQAVAGKGNGKLGRSVGTFSMTPVEACPGASE